VWRDMWRWRDDDFEQKSLLTTYQVYNIVIVEFATSMVMPSTLTVLLLNVVGKTLSNCKKVYGLHFQATYTYNT